MIGRQPFAAARPVHVHPARPDGLHARIPPHPDGAVGHELLERRSHPRLDVAVERRPDVRHGHARAGTHQVDCGFDGRVAAAHHERVTLKGFMPLAIVVRDVRQLLTTDAESARCVEVARRDHDRTGTRHPCPVGPARVEHEQRAIAFDTLHCFVGPHREPGLHHDAPVVVHGIAARRLLARDHEREARERDLLRRREEGDIRRVGHDRAHHTRSIEDLRHEAFARRRHADRESAGTRSDHGEVERRRAHTAAVATASPMIWSRRVPTPTNRMGASTSCSIRSRYTRAWRGSDSRARASAVDCFHPSNHS